MATEFYPLVSKGFDYHDYDTWGPYLGCRVGLGNHEVAFNWAMNPEMGLFLVHAGGGARNAYGTVYTLDMFQGVLRRCKKQDCSSQPRASRQEVREFLARLDPSLLKVQHGQGDPSPAS